MTKNQEKGAGEWIAWSQWGSAIRRAVKAKMKEPGSVGSRTEATVSNLVGPAYIIESCADSVKVRPGWREEIKHMAEPGAKLAKTEAR